MDERINGNINPSIFTVKNIFRILELILLIFVFCPAFLVSCSGSEMTVSAMDAVEGLHTNGGYEVSEPRPILLLCLFIPILMIIITLLKNMLDGNKALCTIILAAIDFVTWMAFRMKVREVAEENYCTFKSTKAFTFNIIILIVLMGFSIAVVAGTIHMNTEFIHLSYAIEPQTQPIKPSELVQTNVVIDIIEEKEHNDSKPQVLFCRYCGKKLDLDSIFCSYCGEKVKTSK